MATPKSNKYVVSSLTAYIGNARPTPSLTLTAPATPNGSVSTISGNFTVSLVNGTGPVRVTFGASAAATFTPTSVNLSVTSPTATFRMTPSTVATYAVSVTNNKGMTNPASVTYGSISTALPNLTVVAGASSGTTGSTIAGPTISAPGGNLAAASWSLSATPAGLTITPSSGTLAPGANVTPTLNAATAAIYTMSLVNGSGGTVNGAPSPANLSAVQYYAPTPPAPAPPPAGPSANFTARASEPNVVWSHDFSTDAEVTAHLKGTTTALDNPGWTKRVIDEATGQSCLEALVIGAGLLQPFTAGGTTMVIDDVYGWPDPAVTGTFRFIAHKKYPAVENAPSRNYFLCTARVGNVLTVTFDSINGFAASNATPLNFEIGDHVGNQLDMQWNRVFSALPAGENGKATNDQAAGGTVPIRSKVATGTYGVPRDLDLWQYGWYGHPENVARWQSWTRWFNSTTYTPRGVVNGADPKFGLWDGNEFWIQFRVKVDARFFQYHKQPDLDSRVWGRKTWGIQSEVSSPQQLVTGLQTSNKFSIPDTEINPFSLATYKAARTVGVDDQNARVQGSPQLGSPWAVAPQFANGTPSMVASSGFPTPDGSPAWEMKANEWVTFLVRVKPGRSFTNDTLIEVKFARTEHPDYNGTYTTLLSVNDAQLVYGNSKDNEYPDGPVTIADVPVMDTLPGFQSFMLFNYLNLDLGSTPPRRSYGYRLGQVIFSKAPIAAPTADPSTAYVGVPRFANAETYDSGSSYASTLTSTGLGKKLNLGPGPNVGIIARVISWGNGSTIQSVTVGGTALTATAQRALAGFSANERVFFLAASTMKDYQSWSVVQADANSRLIVQFYVVRNCTSIASIGTLDLLSNTLNQSVTSAANSLAVGMLTSYPEPCMTQATGSSKERLAVANEAWGAKSFVIEVDATTGSPALTAQRTGQFTGSYIGQTLRLTGQAAVVAPLPTYMPAAGEMSTLTTANGGLTNNFRDECAPYYDAFFYPRTSNTYGGCFKNPYWGTYGAAMFFSGGHGNINDNSVTMAVYGASAVTFKRVTNPTPWFGTGTDGDTKVSNSADIPGPQQFLDWTGAVGSSNLNYGINSIDGAPGATHSYGSGDFIGPADGGALHGTHLRVLTSAINRANTKGAVSALALDFNSDTAPPSANTWRKESLNRVDEPTYGGAAPGMTQWVPAQKRVYIVTNGLTAVRWFDKQTGTYVTGSGVGFDYDLADGFDGGTLFHVPERGLLICAYRSGGNIRIQWMDVTVAQPTLGGTGGGTATLSMTLPVADPWGGATWCPDNNRIILGSITGDDAAMYEVEIPAVLTGNPTWPVTRAPLGAGQTWPVMNTTGEFKRFHYDLRLKAIFYLQAAKRADQGDDVAYIYRPRNT